MTEAEWQASTDPVAMLNSLLGKVSDRKCRLFEVGCCHRIWDLVPEGPWREAALVAERFADREATHREREAARKRATQTRASWGHGAINAAQAAFFATEKVAGTSFFMASAVRAAGHHAKETAAKGRLTRAYKEAVQAETIAQVALARCIFGNPFRPVTLNPAWLAWNGGTVRQLAETIYAERAFERMPILADALEDAGCQDTQVLTHCRGEGPHVRGCFVIDLLLGKI